MLLFYFWRFMKCSELTEILMIFLILILYWRWGVSETNCSGHLVHPDFLISVMPSNITTDLVGAKTVSASGFYLVLRRKPGPYLWLYFVPCFLMILTSWISFAVSFEAVPGRLGLLLTLLLMLINMNNSISESIPKSDGICPLILWVFISIIFIVFALVEYFIILITVKFGSLKSKVAAKKMRKENSKDLQAWASNMDKSSLDLFPTAYFVCVLIFVLTLVLKIE